MLQVGDARSHILHVCKQRGGCHRVAADTGLARQTCENEEVCVYVYVCVCVSDTGGVEDSRLG